MSRQHVEIVVVADPDMDDCLAGAASAYIADHPELDGYDLSPRWTDDDSRETVTLSLPDETREVDAYTSTWTRAAPLGTLVRVSDNPDDRELDDFRRVSRGAGQVAAFVAADDEEGFDVFRLVEGGEDDEFFSF